mgnify:CR=1
MKKFIFALLALSTITSTAFAYDRYDRAKHRSMSACWYYVQQHIGNNYAIYKDTPTEIRGAFGAESDKGFSCVVKNTGTQGTYVQSSISNATRP